MRRALTVGITTRDRPQSLSAAIRSIDLLADLDPEVLVFDDGSDPPAAEGLATFGSRVRVLRDESSPGTTAGRNRLVREATSDLVLLLDDDARLLDRASIERAMALVRADPQIAAVAFAQAEADGAPWPIAMQPSSAEQPVLVQAFIGFAHLLRRSTFLEVGGYREAFGIFGEEKDCCLRFFHHGWLTVYLPDARVAHVPDPANRNRQRYLRLVARNDCLQSIYNDPLPRPFWIAPARFYLYFRMRRAWNIEDPWGWMWVLREVLGRLPAVLAERRPVSWRTLRRWRALGRQHVFYRGAAETHAW